MEERLYIYIMKNLLLLAIGLIIYGIAGAQKSLLSTDEHSKYIYYQVVDLPGVSSDSLSRKINNFIKDVFPKAKSIQSPGGGTMVEDKFVTYSAAVHHQNGEIAYTLSIECKEGRYRFWLTDFVITPYQRNRYGDFVPAVGIDLPLETASSKIEKKELDSYFDQTGAFCTDLGEKLKKYVKQDHPAKKADKPVKKIVTDSW